MLMFETGTYGIQIIRLRVLVGNYVTQTHQTISGLKKNRNTFYWATLLDKIILCGQ
jgi:hypothetical protein